jgi:ABC-2 type transport system ATP-binding protein
MMQPDAGELHVAGINARTHPHEVRRVIGLAGQNAAVEPALTGRENLVMVAKLFGHRGAAAKAAADAVLHEIGLVDAAERPVKGYSGGMRRRLDLGASLVGAPRLLLLDEPTTGLDPRTRMELWASIRSLVQRGTDVLLTTQYLEEADQLADHVVIIGKGRVIAQGSPSELKSQVGGDVIEVHVQRGSQLTAAAAVLQPLGTDDARIDEPGRRIVIGVDHGPTVLGEAARQLVEAGIDLDDIGLRRPTLDEVFLNVTATAS